ncbi:hypothetical protein [Chloroflexus sp.]|nr:hypothetical protein [Chloroflexus sp.]
MTKLKRWQDSEYTIMSLQLLPIMHITTIIAAYEAPITVDPADHR